MGLAAGDALGASLGPNRLTIRSHAFDRVLTGPHREMNQGASLHHPGTVTDDTVMAACLATSLSARRGYSPSDVLLNYAHAAQGEAEVGPTTLAVAKLVRQYQDSARETPVVPALLHRLSTPGGARNGALMRAAPLGIFLAHDQEQNRIHSIVDAALTHFYPEAMLASAILNAVVGHLVTTPVWSSHSAFEVAAHVLASPERLPFELNAFLDGGLNRAERHLHDSHSGGLKSLVHSLTRDATVAANELHHDLKAAYQGRPAVWTRHVHLHRTRNHVRVTLSVALWALFHIREIGPALIDVVNRGGDADTNGAVAGALTGACSGESAIPETWLRAVTSLRPGTSAADTAVETLRSFAHYCSTTERPSPSAKTGNHPGSEPVDNSRGGET